MVAAAVGARLACSGGVRKNLPVVEAGGGERPLHTAGWFISRYTSKLIQYMQVSFVHPPPSPSWFFLNETSHFISSYMVVLVHLFSQVPAYVFDLFQSFSDGSSCWLNPWDAGMPWSTQFDLIPYMIFVFNFRSYFSLISKFLIFQ